MTQKTTTIEDKLDALYKLQTIDSEVDKVRKIQGELPLEIKDLEDELEGTQIRLEKYDVEIKELEEFVKLKENTIIRSNALIKKYTEQQDNVRNNREYEAINKEVEFQKLEVELSEKKIKEAQFNLENKTEAITNFKETLSTRKEDLKKKKADLSDIVKETEDEEKKLMKESAKAEKIIDERLINAYKRIRGNAKNGLAVVTIERNSCGGCFNKVPPQRQIDIKQRKKIIICEHCGRILIDNYFNPNYEEPIEKPKKKRTIRKKTTKKTSKP